MRVWRENVTKLQEFRRQSNPEIFARSNVNNDNAAVALGLAAINPYFAARQVYDDFNGAIISMAKYSSGLYTADDFAYMPIVNFDTIRRAMAQHAENARKKIASK